MDARRPGLCRAARTELYLNNGIETSPDDREFYLVARLDAAQPHRLGAEAHRRLFTRQSAKELRFGAACGFLAGQRSPDERRPFSSLRGCGTMAPACAKSQKIEELMKCRRGYIVATVDPKTMAVTELARGAPTPSFTGVAIAMPVGDELWLSSFNSDRLAYRSLNRSPRHLRITTSDQATANFSAYGRHGVRFRRRGKWHQEHAPKPTAAGDGGPSGKPMDMSVCGISGDGR